MFRSFARRLHVSANAQSNASKTQRTLLRIQRITTATTIVGAGAVVYYVSNNHPVHAEPSSSATVIQSNPAQVYVEPTVVPPETTYLSGVKQQLPSEHEAAQQTLEQLQAYFLDPTNLQTTVEPLFTLNPPEWLGKNEFHSYLESFIRTTQNQICQHLIDIEGNTGIIRQDLTLRSNGTGGGIVRVMSDGHVFQKAGVNTSFTYTQMSPQGIAMLLEDHPSLRAHYDYNNLPKESVPMYSASISLVIHPRNPFVPTVHANYRYFELKLPNKQTVWWFGGGSDLTPTYLNEDDARYFHQTIKTTCDETDSSIYPKWKVACDKYFYTKHRRECRGIGGIFFDDEHSTDFAKRDHYLKLHQTLQRTFSASYFPIVLKHRGDSYTNEHERWQQLRRGRYVEFNLIYDKGTSYGLKHPNARPEAILMSLPLTCRFEYSHIPEKGSPEEQMLDVLKNPRNWV